MDDGQEQPGPSGTGHAPPVLPDAEAAGVQRLLDLARTHLGMEVAWVSHFGPTEQVLSATSGDAAAMHVGAGESTPLHGSFCVRVLAGALPPVIPDARRDLGTRDLQVTGALGIGSYVGAPVHDPQGRVTGMLCCLSRAATPELDEGAARYLALVADLVSDHLTSTAALEERAVRRDRDRIETVLDAGAVRMLFQPVVRLHDGLVVSYEALARFDHPDLPTTEHAFAAARRAGLGARLELLALRSALGQRDRLPAGTTLAVNTSPEALLDPDVQDELQRHAERARGEDRTICVEITEHVQVSDYGALTHATGQLRAAGARLAVDDAGAGYASFRHILRLAPDSIKIDLDLVRGLDGDPARLALARSLVAFAGEVGAELVAEGVETPAEHEALLGLGVPLGQGYLHGRPAPLPNRAAATSPR